MYAEDGIVTRQGGGLQHMGRSGAKNKAACYSDLTPGTARPKR